MSSTNRGGKRHVSDYYVTPQEDVKQFLAAFLTVAKIDRPDRLTWFDPCTGGDEFHEASYKEVIKNAFEPEIISMDIRADSHADIVADYLTVNSLHECDVVIGNPPFNEAERFIRKAVKHVDEGGYVAFLLRLNFYGTDGRKALFKELGLPKYTFIHPDRISFTADGKSDSIEYGHFVWKRGEYNRSSQTFLLDGFDKKNREEMRSRKRDKYSMLAAVMAGRFIKDFFNDK